MLKVLLKRLQSQVEEILAEEQTGFRAGTLLNIYLTSQILSEKYLKHQHDLYHIFSDFKKVFNMVWHDALWSTMRQYHIGDNLTSMVEQLYNEASSAVINNERLGEWFTTSTGVRQGCLLSPTLFNIFLVTPEYRCSGWPYWYHEYWWWVITNLWFADDTDGMAGNEEELNELIKCLDRTAKALGMEINAEKTKKMT